MKGANGFFDFEKIMPIPEYIDRADILPNQPLMTWPFNRTWYEWCNVNWNTKWNACVPDIERSRQEWTFECATTPYANGNPVKVIGKLAELFPQFMFIHLYADEDLGYNCGYEEYHNGKMTKQINGSILLAKSIWGLPLTETAV